ncbi:MAG: hypothetical protein AAGC93_21720 [Cyanobacteria bacterium P01_F01_bin.53]
MPETTSRLPNRVWTDRAWELPHQVTDKTTQLAYRNLSSRRKPYSKSLSHDDGGSVVVDSTPVGVDLSVGRTIMNPNTYYHVGGSLARQEASYVTRTTDGELYHAIQKGLFCTVVGPRQIGKSSLRIRTSHRLQQQGYRCASVQGTQLDTAFANQAARQLDSSANNILGNQEGVQLEPPGWDKQLISLIWDSLHPGDVKSLSRWLSQTSGFSPLERLERFTQELLNAEAQASPLVIFLDEIDHLLDIPDVAAVLFQWIEQHYRNRDKVEDIKLEKDNRRSVVTFSVFGSFISSDLIKYWPKKRKSSQLDEGLGRCEFTLHNFRLTEAQQLCQGFENLVDSPAEVLEAIFQWTNGQPFLTQKLCQITADRLAELNKAQAELPNQFQIESGLKSQPKPLALSPKALSRWMTQTVYAEVLHHWRRKDDPSHLRAIGDRITHSPNNAALIALYQRIAVGSPVALNGSQLQGELLMSGLVIIANQHLQFNNEIYRHVFDPILAESSELPLAANNPTHAAITR